MNPPQSSLGPIFINDPPSADTEVVSPTPDTSHDQAPSPVERDNMFYFETITFQVC